MDQYESLARVLCVAGVNGDVSQDDVDTYWHEWLPEAHAAFRWFAENSPKEA
jgi:hypothetical protein